MLTSARGDHQLSSRWPCFPRINIIIYLTCNSVNLADRKSIVQLNEKESFVLQGDCLIEKSKHLFQSDLYIMKHKVSFKVCAPSRHVVKWHKRIFMNWEKGEWSQVSVTGVCVSSKEIVLWSWIIQGSNHPLSLFIHPVCMTTKNVFSAVVKINMTLHHECHLHLLYMQGGCCQICGRGRIT